VETSGREERREDVAHDVDLELLLALELLPDDGVVEHAERLGVELALELDRPAGVEHVHAVLRPHRHEHAHTCTPRTHTHRHQSAVL